MKLTKKIWTILTTLIIVTTLLFTQTHNVYAGQKTVEEKVLNALRDVVGIDVDKYAINVTSYRASPIPGYEKSYRGEEDIRLILESKESKLSVIAQYFNNHLIYLYTSILSGSSSDVHYLNKLSEDPLIATQETLHRLKDFTGNLAILDMLKILEPAKNAADIDAKTVGNIKCKVFTDLHTFDSKGMHPVNGIYFMYSFKGAESPKSIGIHFENGLFKGFNDAWDVYSVGSEVLKVSKEQAIDMAKKHATSSTSESLKFPSDRPVVAELHLAVRGEDFVLYPFWFVEVPLVYPLDSSIYGWQEGIWADTGEILYGHPVGGYGVDINNNADVDGSELSSGAGLISSQRTINPTHIVAVIAVVLLVVIGLSVVVLKKR
ncbi:MAG: hypothetical protein FWD52_02030 [Candidatus Bathyarchaeota archaeon]|nr:hypothetical protein [Candidatus Termiticorpusculum sp.]